MKFFLSCCFIVIVVFISLSAGNRQSSKKYLQEDLKDGIYFGDELAYRFEAHEYKIKIKVFSDIGLNLVMQRLCNEVRCKHINVLSIDFGGLDIPGSFFRGLRDVGRFELINPNIDDEVDWLSKLSVGLRSKVWIIKKGVNGSCGYTQNGSYWCNS